MIILDENHLREIGIDWNRTIDVMEDTVWCMEKKQFAQPLKPYLRYRDLKNRIIAMPAFVGGPINKAGIKWIASFPDNIKKGIPRAHSVVILNEADTGEPVAIICTALLSIIRTASVSGMMIRHYRKSRHTDHVNVGIIGFGPIGQYHLKMCLAVLGESIGRVFVYDIRSIDPQILRESGVAVEVVSSWEEAYLNSDIVMTCTVSDAPYIDKQPKPGSLHLNISLRDYKSSVFPWFKDSIIVDDWEEVCRENTDIEKMHVDKGLQAEQTRSIIDVVAYNCLEEYSRTSAIMFNPMGMGVFDIALGNFYYLQAMASNALA